MAKRKLPPLRPLSEDEAWEIALNDHPEYREGIEDGTLPEEILDERGELMNPRLHLTLHTIVEKQLASDEPKGIAEIARELAARGVSRHNIRHLMATPLAEQLWAMQTEGAQFDEDEYLAHLRDIVDSYH